MSEKNFSSPDALASEIVEQLLANVVTGDTTFKDASPAACR